MSNQPQLHWYDPVWRQQAHDWIRTEAQHRSVRITGEIEQPHATPWSTVMRIPTNEGTLFFKASAAETIYESALTQMLVGWYPDCMSELIAVDARRGWMLMRNGGESLRTLIRPTRDIKPWEPIITQYAEVQIGLADHVDELLTLGLPDHRPVTLPALYSQLLADTEIIRVDQEKGTASVEYQQLQDLTPRFARICADLMAYGIPDSLNHGDFHDGNVLIKNGRVTFFDWGDASVTHPFVSLRTFFVSIEITLDLEEYAFTPEMAGLLDRYLEPWQVFGSKETLASAYNLSKPVASIAKALAWRQVVSRLEGALRDEYVHIVPEVLREFLYHMERI